MKKAEKAENPENIEFSREITPAARATSDDNGANVFEGRMRRSRATTLEFHFLLLVYF